MRALVPILLSLNILFTDGLLPASMTAALLSVPVSSKETFSVRPARSTFVPTDFSGVLHSENTDQTATAKPQTDVLSLSAPSVLLMEASTGTILYEKDSHTILRPASITKIMTLLLIFDALSAGQISLEDTVTVSEYAASMGGSQVFLEAGETQTVDTMIKCISVASANDACVAMSEYLCGSESVFVEKMNERANGLGMNDTHFMNCCGLDVDGHVTSAYDVALMSRELTVKYKSEAKRS